MKIKEGFRLRDVMGQATVIGEGVAQVNFSKLITLNSTAAYLWNKVVDKEFDVDMLADFLVEEYGIDREIAIKDSSAIAERWMEIGLAE